MTPPIAESPANESAVKALAPTLTWQPSPQGGWYYAEIATSPEIDPNSQQGSFISQNIVAFTTGRLSAVTSWTAPALPNGTYYWHVLAGEAGTNIPSPFTPPWRFTLDSAPTLSYPVGNAVAPHVAPVFSWEPLASAPRYLVEISREPTFDLEIYGNVIVALTTSTTYSPGNKLTHGKYWWRVRGETGEGADCGQGTMRCGTFSPAAEFLIDGAPPSVVNPGPRQEGWVGTPMTFNGSAEDGLSGIDSNSYYWKFGDGGEGGGPQVVHAYSASGSYSVSLQVKDIAGNAKTGYTQVVVKPVPGTEPLKPAASLVKALVFDRWMYPNPFFPGKNYLLRTKRGVLSLRATSFCFTLSKPAYVTINVLGAKGVVKKVVMSKKLLPAKRHYIGWTGTDAKGKVLPPGNYGYALTALSGRTAKVVRGTVSLR